MENKHFGASLAKENVYPKLVRDKIPEIVGQRTGKEVKTRILENDVEYLEFLLKKVEEEAYELAHAEGRVHQAMEIADMMEIFDALIEINSLDWDEIMAIKKDKAIERGAFKKRILMLEKVD